ncbi:hypothetical protein [Mesorhizobium sp. M1396]|uniref:hypothetical protein n=1 Tax=Mesorhizobium sp. M1396 TaxID=2957095 RepID=UPI00333A4EB2
MAENKTHYETGATKYPAKTDADASDEFSQDAAGNKKPAGGVGLTRRMGEVEGRTHQSDGQNPPRQATPGTATEKASGASPAVAGRSKGTKAPKIRRQQR